MKKQIDEDDFFEESGTPMLGIMDYLRIIRERWLLGAATGIVLSGLFVLYMFSRTPLYTSSLQLLVDVAQDNVVDMDQVVDDAEIARSSKAESLLKHHLIELQSRKFRDYVVASLEPRERDRILRAYVSEELVDPDVSNVLGNGVSLSLNTRDMVYTIAATHRDSEVAAEIANLYASKYIEYVLSDVGSSNASAIAFLQKNAENLQRSILEDKRILQRFRKENRIITVDDSRSIAIEKIVSLNAQKADLDVELQNYETVLDQLTARGVVADSVEDTKIGLALEVAQISDFGSIGALKNALDKAISAQNEIELIFLERHPNYIENKDRIDDLRSRLKSEISLAIKSFETSTEKLRTQIEKSHAELVVQEKETQRLDNLAILEKELESKIANNQATLAQVDNRLNETTISTQLSKANMRVVDDALESYIPSYPNRKRTIMTAAFLFGLGLVVVPIGLNLFDDRLKSPWDVEEFVGKSLLGEVALVDKSKNDQVHSLVADGEDQMAVDTFRSIYNTIKLNTHNVEKKVQVVTSTIPDEGKTMFCMNYAVTVAQHGRRVLLIDCDLRKPQIQGYLGEKSEEGLVHWYQDGGELGLNGELYKTLGIHKVSRGVFLLPAGRATNRSTEMVENEKFANLIALLSDDFDQIIIDTPPVGVFPDAMFLAEYAQEVIYVTRHDKVSRAAVKGFIDRLDQTAATVCGVVLNRRKVKNSKGGYYGYGYGYNASHASKYYNKYYTTKS